MTFFAVFESLCTKLGKSPNAVAKELNIPSGSITAWKDGSTPRLQTISKIAAYFGVSTDYLLGNTTQKEPATVPGSELSEAEQQLIALFRTVPVEKQSEVIRMIDSALEIAGLKKPQA